MAFANYRYTEEGSTRHYTRGHEVQLTGPEGILATYLRTLKPTERDTVSWELSGLDLCKLACPNCTHTQKELVLDLYPEGLVEVCLHRVERIVGVSDDDWTDAILVTRPLLVGIHHGTAAETRQGFTIELPLSAREAMEAIGIRGGYKKGSYRWTQPKMNIGAACCGGNSGGGCNCASGTCS